MGILKRLWLNSSYLVIMGVLFVFSFHSYLLFHTTVEIVSIIIACAIFMFSWNAKNLMKNSYFLFIGISFLSISIIDYFHILSYSGIHILAYTGSDTSTQLWISGRLIQSFSFLFAPIFIHRKLPRYLSLIISTLLALFVLLGVFTFHTFPATFRADIGLTNFKKFSELVICLIYTLAIFQLNKLSLKIDKHVILYIKASLVLGILTELFFSIYVTVFDFYTILGHLSRLLAYFFIYKAVIEIGLSRPYQIMFREIKQLNQRKDDFINVASHEIRNPLTTIKLYTQYLQKNLKGSSNPHIAAALSKIDHQSNEINRLIGDMLDINRIDTGKLSLTPVTFYLDDLIRNIITDICRKEPTRNIIFYSASKTLLQADQGRISQVINNLLSNAIKYSPSNKRIIIRLKRNKQEILVSIQDFGQGIQKEHLTSIFEKYHRTPTGEKTASGLGLGLYLAKQIVSLHHGRIWCESELGKGTVFYFSLPAE